MPRKYDLIIIAIGSFQLIHDQTDAQQVLNNLSNALLPGGKLILETYIPWDVIKNNIDGSILSDQSKEITVERVAHSPNGFKIINQSKVTADFKKQLEVSHTRYEKWDGKLISAEEEQYTVRWYHRYEMELFLQKAGLR